MPPSITYTRENLETGDIMEETLNETHCEYNRAMIDCDSHHIRVIALHLVNEWNASNKWKYRVIE